MSPAGPSTATPLTTTQRGIAWATASAIAYSVSAILGKNLLDTLRPSDMLFWRFAIGAAVLWAVLAVRTRGGGPRPATVPWRTLVVLGAMFCYTSILGFIGLEYLDASLFIVLVYVYPAFVALLSPLIGLRVGRTLWGALALTLAGVALTADLAGGDRRVSTVGLLLAMGQASTYAVYMIITSRVVQPQTDGMLTMGWSLIGSVIGMAGLAAFVGLRVPSTGRVVLELVAFAIVPTVVSGACFYQAMRCIAPTSVAMIATLEPVFTIVWAVTLLGERLGVVQVIGAAFVLSGVLWSQRAML